MVPEFLKYIKPELLVLIAVMWLIGYAIKKIPRIPNWSIPFWLIGISIALALLWVLGSEPVTNIALAVFTAIVQGVCIAGVAVLGHQITVQVGNAKDSSTDGGAEAGDFK